MRGDETGTGDFGPENVCEPKGPRHAAPRKSLLTNLHMPAGKKAFALAAMPMAVFVGMGLSPRFALADDNDIPVIGTDANHAQTGAAIGLGTDYYGSGVKAGEIASDLYVSVNTVKAHLRSMYRKLGVSNRREAVERARTVGLLR